MGCGGASTNSRALPLGTREAIGGGLRLGAPPRQGPGPYRLVFPRQVCIIGMCEHTEGGGVVCARVRV